MSDGAKIHNPWSCKLTKIKKEFDARDLLSFNKKLNDKPAQTIRENRNFGRKHMVESRHF